MLVELMGGRAQLLQVTASGRHRYYRLASPDIARLIETMMQLAARTAAIPGPRLVIGPKDAALRAARTCYDHLAGRLGVAVTQRLVSDGGLVLDKERTNLNDRGRRALADLGIDVPTGAARGSRIDPWSCRPCLDWSERRHHIAGRLATHICHACVQRGWIHRRTSSQAVDVTPLGRVALQAWLGLELWNA